LNNFNRSSRILLALLAIVAGACSGGAKRLIDPFVPSRTHVVMINGGGAAFMNYQSHMLHVQDLLEILRSSGVDADSITIFSSDGSAPKPDLAVRERAEEGSFWRLKGTRLSRILQPIRFENSEIPGFSLLPATHTEISRWFAARGSDLKAGDTLLLYVTDHGEKNRENSRNNTITLWESEEGFSVEHLRALLGHLDSHVRVVMLMSQCFSGSFAGLAFPPSGPPQGNVCGYFSSTAQRPAYGCYAENLGRKNVGHSFLFMQALVETGRFDRAHEKVLYTDATPDVPLRTSEVYLRRLLYKAARAAGKSFESYVDELLGVAWQDRGAWEAEIRQLDRIGHAFGYFSPRSLDELNQKANGLVDLNKHLDSVADAWLAALGDANFAAIAALLDDDPTWKELLTPETLRALPPNDLQTLAGQLVDDLAKHAKAAPKTEERLELLHSREEAAAAASYRMEVRRAVVLRLRNQLVQIAGRVYLSSKGTPEERQAYGDLLVCEALSLPIGEPDRTELVPAKAFPPFADDVAAATAALPGWLGVRFRTLQKDEAERHRVEKGAAEILAVFDDSAAARAGMRQGDIILGSPDAPFTQPNELRSWVMLSEAGKARKVEILRKRQRLQLTMIPDPFPAQFPELPGPPKVGTVAPPVNLSTYRGKAAAVGKGKPHLLVFWATWCAPCKAAVPELEAYAAKTGTRLIGITDQRREELDKFFKDGGEFLDNIAIDDYRQTFLAYGVSGTPTFVLIDATGKVESYSTGYSAEKGIGIEGWKWSGKGR
jgi:thiol-disulfide isomerase/thioredoxin